MIPLLWIALAATAVVAVAAKAASSSDEPRVRRTAGTRALDKKIPIVRMPPPKAGEPLQFAYYTNWASREPVTINVADVPASKPITIDVRVFAPRFSQELKIPGVGTFTYQAGPDGSAGVLAKVLAKVSELASAAAPAAGAALQGYGVPPGVVEAAVAAATEAINSIPNAIRRSLVRKWMDWREGNYGRDKRLRQQMRDEVALWHDSSWIGAAEVSYLCAHWRFKVDPSDYDKSFPVQIIDPKKGDVPPYPKTPCLKSDAPNVRTQALAGGYARVWIDLAPTQLGVSERRYSILID
jgi:hypothetical protein